MVFTFFLYRSSVITPGAIIFSLRTPTTTLRGQGERPLTSVYPTQYSLHRPDFGGTFPFCKVLGSRSVLSQRGRIVIKANSPLPEGADSASLPCPPCPCCEVLRSSKVLSYEDVDINPDPPLPGGADPATLRHRHGRAAGSARRIRF